MTDTKIPRILHYCWFGRGDKPDKIQRCMKSWDEFCTDYKVLEWNEENAPIDHPYLQNALKHENWANASNFVRLWAIEKHGGIYLDTDVEVLKSMDRFHNESCFFAWQDYRKPDLVNNAIFGAISHHWFITELKEQLLTEFDGTEAANESSPTLVSKQLIKNGLPLWTSRCPKTLFKEFRQTTVKDITVFPRKFFYPYLWDERFNPACVTSDTHCIHHWSLSWHD